MNVSTSCHMTDNTCSAGLWTEFATKKIASEYDIVMWPSTEPENKS